MCTSTAAATAPESAPPVAPADLRAYATAAEKELKSLDEVAVRLMKLLAPDLV